MDDRDDRLSVAWNETQGHREGGSPAVLDVGKPTNPTAVVIAPRVRTGPSLGDEGFGGPVVRFAPEGRAF